MSSEVERVWMEVDVYVYVYADVCTECNKQQWYRGSEEEGEERAEWLLLRCVSLVVMLNGRRGQVKQSSHRSPAHRGSVGKLPTSMVAPKHGWGHNAHHIPAARDCSTGRARHPPSPSHTLDQRTSREPA